MIGLKNTCFGIIFLFFTHFNISAQNATQANISGTSSIINISNNMASVVDNAIVLTANGNITGFTVSITGSYTSGDVLSYTGCLPSGITAVAFNAATRSLVFSGTTTPANWEALMRTVTLTTTSAVCNPESRLVSFVVGIKYYNIFNGHFYEYYGTNSSWTAAKTYIDGLSYFGRAGYMATLASQSENSFVSVLIGQNSWIGCSDNRTQVNTALGYTAYASQAAVDGNFYWVTGPERGAKISSQNDWGGGVAPVSGAFNAWSALEPNDHPGHTTATPGEEDYGHMYTGTATWNDFSNSQSIGSIIEFGGMPNDNTTSQVVFTRTVFINGAPSGTITGGNVSVCSGINSTTMTLTGLTGTVVRWESSLDNFLTAGIPIVNTSNLHTASNITTSTYYRVIVNTLSGCSNLATSSTPVFVNTTIAGNIIAANNTICTGSSASFTLFGNTGSVLKWQVSTSSTFASAVTDISNTSTTMSYTLGSTGTYYFRAVVQFGSCGSPANTPGYTISVIAGTSPVGGSITSAEHCGGSNTGTLTLSGHTGSIQKWQYSTDGGIIWTDVANITSTLIYVSVSANRLYRAVLTNGSCGTAYSNSGVITVYGTTITRWDGGTSNAWQTSANWCGGIADNGMDLVISSSASNQLVLDQNRIIGTLNFNGSGRYITLGNYSLTTASISNANSSSYIKTNGSGVLKTNIANAAMVIFHVGDQAYNPLTITNNTGRADYLSVRVLNEVFYNGTSGFTSPVGRVKRTWDISKTNPNGGSGLNFVFSWNPGETVSLVTPALFHYESGGWNQQVGSTTIIGTSLTYVNYTGTFSPFSIGSGSVALSADLIDFEAKAQISTNSVLLTWKTSSEHNNAYFEVERSFDGQNWHTIGRVDGAGNTNNLSTYEFTDINPGSINYYRLKQVSLDGKSSSHEIRKVDFNVIADDIIRIYPNPSNGLVNILTVEPAVFKVMDIKGRSIMEGEVNGEVQLNGLAAGFYMIHISIGQNIYYVKLLME